MVCDNKKVCITLENLPSRQVLYQGIWNAGRDDTRMAGIRSLSPCTRT